MKKLLFLIPAVALLLFALSLAVLEGAATAVLQQLDIPEQIARDCVWSSFTGMYLSYPNPQKLRLTPVEKRAAFVREIVQWARAYTQSEEFMGRYRQYRETVKPAPPEKPKTMDEIRRESLEQIRNSIRETEENLKGLPAEHQAMMRDVIKTMREQEQSLADPNNPMFSRDMDATQNQAYAEEMERFKAKLAEWDRDYPADTATPMIRRWLTEFLRVSEGIDFDARLTTNKYGRKVFADPALEQRPSNWKLCYRAGKETVEAGRASASQWLEELNASSR